MVWRSELSQWKSARNKAPAGIKMCIRLDDARERQLFNHYRNCYPASKKAEIAMDSDKKLDSRRE
jgi:hypothetical protein